MCAAKNQHGLETLDLLIELVLSLTPNQVGMLYTELLSRYKPEKARTKRYNKDGELDPKGKVRLTEYQHKAIRTKYGETYMRRAYTEMSNYIEYLEHNIDVPRNRQALQRINSRTHNPEIGKTDGWVYRKCQQYVCVERPKININPYLIDDFATAREYIKSIPPALRESMDVKLLIQKFPELLNVEYE